MNRLTLKKNEENTSLLEVLCKNSREGEQQEAIIMVNNEQKKVYIDKPLHEVTFNLIAFHRFIKDRIYKEYFEKKEFEDYINVLEEILALIEKTGNLIEFKLEESSKTDVKVRKKKNV